MPWQITSITLQYSIGISESIVNKVVKKKCFPQCLGSVDIHCAMRILLD